MCTDTAIKVGFAVWFLLFVATGVVFLLNASVGWTALMVTLLMGYSSALPFVAATISLGVQQLREIREYMESGKSPESDKNSAKD